MNSLSSLPRLSRNPEEKTGSGKRYLELLDNSLSSSERSEISPYVYQLSESSSARSFSLTDGEKSEVSAETEKAMWLLNLTGCRIIRRTDGLAVGIWEDLDCQELRSAICALGLSRRPVIYLEIPGVPMRYKVRSCPDRARGESFSAWLRRVERKALRPESTR
jgi:hypothetical protein